MTCSWGVPVMWKGVFSVTGDAQEETDESEATVEEVQVLLKSRISCRFWVKKNKNKNKTKLDDNCLQFAHIHVWQGFYKFLGDKSSFPPQVKVESWKVVLSLSLWPKICSVTIQIEPHNEHFHIVLEISSWVNSHLQVHIYKSCQFFYFQKSSFMPKTSHWKGYPKKLKVSGDKPLDSPFWFPWSVLVILTENLSLYREFLGIPPVKYFHLKWIKILSAWWWTRRIWSLHRWRRIWG